jgi:hypothetical protein
MSFKNLEERFNAKVNQLYAGSKSKFENGRPSNGANDDPLIVRRPGDGYWGFGESRSTPVRSAALDVKRLTLFTLSTRGIAFLAKQQLLQTGNTFEAQRVINPLFTVGNAVPFLHSKRSLDIPVTARGIGRQLLGGGALANRIFGSGKQQNGPDDLRKIAQLQKETYDKLANTPPSGVSFLKKIPVIGQTISAFSAKRSVGENISFKLSRPELVNYVAARFNRDGYKFKYGGTVEKATKYGTRGDGRNYTAYYNKIAENGRWAFSTDYKNAGFVPDLNKFVLDPKFAPRNDSPVTTTNLSDTATDNDLVKKLDDSGYEEQLKTQQSRHFESGVDSFTTFGQTPYLKYFTGGQGSITGLPKRENGKIVSRNAKYEANGIGRISYLKDDSNRPIAGRPNAKILPAYNDLQTAQISEEGTITAGFDDPIVVSFAMGKDDHVQFRAFISNLQQSASPEYKTYQYIGRIEKFVSYVSVQRDVSFKLGIIAFSKDELDIVWKRINYLTGLVYPYGINKGILQPNVVRMTIGKLYTNQPGYITSLSTNFNEITDSWDIDKQVPIGATMDMKFTIIEKRTALASTPLYGITENVSGFAKTLTPESPPTTTEE